MKSTTLFCILIAYIACEFIKIDQYIDENDYIHYIPTSYSYDPIISYTIYSDKFVHIECLDDTNYKLYIEGKPYDHINRLSDYNKQANKHNIDIFRDYIIKPNLYIIIRANGKTHIEGYIECQYKFNWPLYIISSFTLAAFIIMFSVIYWAENNSKKTSQDKKTK